MRLYEQILSSKAIVVLGSGGVGKTTTAIGLAILAAKFGRKVGVLSIDPSKRLAAALGFQPSSELTGIDLSFLGNDVNGSLSAAVVDQKKIFDDIVRRYGKSKKQVDAILEHPLYQAASGNMSGPIEYMSLAKFADLYEDESFDLVILDTPPDNNALDFLARPNLLAGFIDKNIMRWMIKPFAVMGRMGMSRFLSVSEKLMGGLSKITGVSMLAQFANFLVLMQEVIEGFHSLGGRVLKVLKDKKTRFFLVVGASEDRMLGVTQFTRQLNEMGYPLASVVANRCFGEDLLHELADMPSDHSHIKHYKKRAIIQKKVLDELSALALEQKDCQLYEIEDLVADIDNKEMFVRYIDMLAKS